MLRPAAETAVRVASPNAGAPVGAAQSDAEAALEEVRPDVVAAAVAGLPDAEAAAGLPNAGAAVGLPDARAAVGLPDVVAAAVA